MDARAIFELLCSRQNSQQRIDSRCGPKSVGVGQRHTACQVFGREPRKIQRRSLPRNRRFRGYVVNLNPANSHPFAGGKNFQFFLLIDHPGD